MKAIVMRLFGAPPINQAYRLLTGNTAAIPAMLYCDHHWRWSCFDHFRALRGRRFIKALQAGDQTDG
jgi:hypothetical protein